MCEIRQYLFHLIFTSVPDYEGLSFLELGHGGGFTALRNSRKVSVDLNKPEATHHMSTDEFFNMNKDKFDVIYIDACHEFSHVLRDWNNSINVINDGGVIFVHDTYPPNESWSHDGACGDSFKMVLHMMNVGFNIRINKPDFGLMVTQDFRGIEIKDIDSVNYEEFDSIVSRDEFYERYYIDHQPDFIEHCIGLFDK